LLKIVLQVLNHDFFKCVCPLEWSVGSTDCYWNHIFSNADIYILIYRFKPISQYRMRSIFKTFHMQNIQLLKCLNIKLMEISLCGVMRKIEM